MEKAALYGGKLCEIKQLNYVFREKRDGNKFEFN